MNTYKEFQFLNNHASSILNTYQHDDLLTKTIIRNEETNKYMIFNTRYDFEQWYMNQSIKHCHEVILNNQIQRLKFDIDYTSSETIMFHSILYSIIDTIIDVLIELYGETDYFYPSRDDFIITTSSGAYNNTYKYSYHIILYTAAVYNNEEAKQITSLVINKVNPLYQSYIDPQVNKSIQNFRLLYSTKKGSDRCKLLYTNTQLVDLFDTMIVPFNGIKVLSKLFSTDYTPANLIENTPDIITKITEFYPEIMEGFVYRNTKNNMINFNRIKATHCFICNEIHHHDHSLVLQISDNHIYEFCRQANKSRLLLSLCSPEKELDLFTNLESNIYSAPEMREYELVPTLVVKAQMKLGKTKMLHKFVSTHFDNHIIRMISFRQTYSNHIHHLFNDFDLYSAIKGNIDHSYKKLIIQVESLYRLKIDKNPIDLLILDEIESIFNQFNSGLHKHFTASFAIFIWMLSTAKYVICIDANVSNRTYNLLLTFRKHPIYFHHNQYSSSKDDQYYITRDKSIWISNLAHSINMNQKIAIPTNSINEAKTLESLLKDKYPNKIIKAYHSETLQSEKQLHFNDVHTYWSQLDILIYSPTCSAGISYELKHFDVIFGLFVNSSCDVETCRQMINRIRNISSKKIYVYLQEIGSKQLPITTKELHDYLVYKRNVLLIDNNIQYTFDKNGNIKFYETDYYHLWLENEIIHNLSKNNFTMRFINQIKQSGATILCMQSYHDDTSMITQEEYTSFKKQIKQDKYNDISHSIELEEEQKDHILYKIDQQLELSKEEYLSYEKYKLRKCYQYAGDICPKFVEIYGTKDVQFVYHNLCEITQCSTIEESIQKISKKESNRYQFVMTAENKTRIEYNDLLYDKIIYTSLSHKIASYILLKFGQSTSMKLDTFNELLENDIWNVFTKYKKYLSIEFNIDLTKNKKNIANRLLFTMYGIKITKIKEIIYLKKHYSKFIFYKPNTDQILSDIIPIITNNELFLKLD